jgi:hypothetical protein
VLFVNAALVGAVGVPVKAGEARGANNASADCARDVSAVKAALVARLESKVPESCTLPEPSDVMMSPGGAVPIFAAAVAAVVVLPDPATATVAVDCTVPSAKLILLAFKFTEIPPVLKFEFDITVAPLGK